jgi:uncharacterized protein (TIGR03435 family)
MVSSKLLAFDEKRRVEVYDEAGYVTPPRRARDADGLYERMQLQAHVLRAHAGFPHRIKEQLGLKLQPDRERLPFLVVDHIKRATEN